MELDFVTRSIEIRESTKAEIGSSEAARYRARKVRDSPQRQCACDDNAQEKFEIACCVVACHVGQADHGL